MENIKILHVDDDSDILAIAKISLEDIGGFEIHQSSSGEEAIKAVSEFTPDILLLDVMMPQMSGVELLHVLRDLPQLQHTPAIFMTAIDHDVKVQELKNTDMIGIISKPFDPVQLPEEIKSLYSNNMKREIAEVL